MQCVRRDLSRMDPKCRVWTKHPTKTLEYIHPSLMHKYLKLPDELGFLSEQSAAESQDAEEGTDGEHHSLPVSPTEDAQMAKEDTEEEEHHSLPVSPMEDAQTEVETEQEVTASLIPSLRAWSTDTECETQSYGIRIRCCCGLAGDYDEVYSIQHGPLVQCLRCLCHSHIACQQSPASHDTAAKQ